MENKLVVAMIVNIVVILLFIIGYHLFRAYQSSKAYALYLQAGVMSEENNLDTAIKLLEQAVKIDSYKPEFRWNLASMYYIKGRVDDAIPHLEYLLKQNPNALGVKKLLVMVLLQKGDRITAKEICKTIVEFDSDPFFHDILRYLEEIGK